MVVRTLLWVPALGGRDRGVCGSPILPRWRPACPLHSGGDSAWRDHGGRLRIPVGTTAQQPCAGARSALRVSQACPRGHESDDPGLHQQYPDRGGPSSPVLDGRADMLPSKEGGRFAHLGLPPSVPAGHCVQGPVRYHHGQALPASRETRTAGPLTGGVPSAALHAAAGAEPALGNPGRGRAAGDPLLLLLGLRECVQLSRPRGPVAVAEGVECTGH